MRGQPIKGSPRDDHICQRSDLGADSPGLTILSSIAVGHGARMSKVSTPSRWWPPDAAPIELSSLSVRRGRTHDVVIGTGPQCTGGTDLGSRELSIGVAPRARCFFRPAASSVQSDFGVAVAGFALVRWGRLLSCNNRPVRSSLVPSPRTLLINRRSSLALLHHHLHALLHFRAH